MDTVTPNDCIHEEECDLTFCTKILLKVLNVPCKKFYQYSKRINNPKEILYFKIIPTLA